MTVIRRPAYSYRADPAVPVFPDDRPVIVFDGHCVMCSSGARWLLRIDRRRRFRVLAAQSSLGRALYVHYGLDPEDYETNLLIQDGEAWMRSAAFVRVAAGLGLPWAAASLLWLLPAALLDRAYNLIARNRFRLFGRSEACYLAEPGEEDRFLT